MLYYLLTNTVSPTVMLIYYNLLTFSNEVSFARVLLYYANSARALEVELFWVNLSLFLTLSLYALVLADAQ